MQSSENRSSPMMAEIPPYSRVAQRLVTTAASDICAPTFRRRLSPLAPLPRSRAAVPAPVPLSSLPPGRLHSDWFCTRARKLRCLALIPDVVLPAHAATPQHAMAPAGREPAQSGLKKTLSREG
eukprot:180305-Rhodomonas_salina.2